MYNIYHILYTYIIYQLTVFSMFIMFEHEKGKSNYSYSTAEFIKILNRILLLL